MTAVVNLNKMRKARDRTAQKAQADANAAKHGRTKAERLLDTAKEQQAAKRLDALKFDDT